MKVTALLYGIPVTRWSEGWGLLMGSTRQPSLARVDDENESKGAAEKGHLFG